MHIGVLFLAAASFGRLPLAPCVASDGQTRGLCGSYEVFENRAAKAGRKIPLRILVLPALGSAAAADPVFLFAGGPGESAVDALPHLAVVHKLRANRHVVAVDQRGTGGSNPLPCAAKDLDKVSNDLFQLDRVRVCRAELEKRADLTQYTTTNFVDDVDEVRATMGFPRISIYGASYGTESAQIYLRRHEAHVRAVALKAVKPVQQKLPLLLSQTIQASIERTLAGNRDLYVIMERLAKRPDPFPTGAFVSALRVLLYYPRRVQQLPDLLREAARGNWTPFTTTYLATVRGVEPRIARGMHFSVLCSEDVPATSEAEVVRETAGTWLGDYQVRQYRKVCRLWPHSEPPAGFFDPVRSAKPVLLIAGENDPATPVESARLVARTLSNSRVVTIRGGTHSSGSSCLDEVIVRFIVNAKTVALPSCPELY